MRKKDRKWLKHIEIFDIGGASVQHLPHGPISRLCKMHFIEIRPTMNYIHYDRAVITEAGKLELTPSE